MKTRITSGRPRKNPQGTSLEAFTLWPEHIATIERYMHTHAMGKSEALRAILTQAPAPGAPAAKRAATALRYASAKITETVRPPDAVEAAKQAARARNAERARIRRAKERTAKGRSR
jgi:hypothetical protein